MHSLSEVLPKRGLIPLCEEEALIMQQRSTLPLAGGRLIRLKVAERVVLIELRRESQANIVAWLKKKCGIKKLTTKDASRFIRFYKLIEKLGAHKFLYLCNLSKAALGLLIDDGALEKAFVWLKTEHPVQFEMLTCEEEFALPSQQQASSMNDHGVREEEEEEKEEKKEE